MAFATRSIPICVKAGIALRSAKARAGERVRQCLTRIAIGMVIASGAVRPGAAGELQQQPTEYPLCSAASLAGFPWTHPAFGKHVPGIALRNMSLMTCRVAGYPQLRAYDSAGRGLDIGFERRPFIDTQLYAYSVTPGSAVFFALYGQAPKGDFDRTCAGINRVAVVLPDDTRPIDVTLSTGTCGGRMSYSQMFPVSELAR